MQGNRRFCWFFLLLIHLNLLAKEPVLGTVTKTSSSSVVMRFEEGHGIKKGMIVNIFAKNEDGSPGQAIGTVKISKVAKTKVAGKLKRMNDAPKKLFKDAIAVYGELNAPVAISTGSVPPRIEAYSGGIYSIIRTESYYYVKDDTATLYKAEDAPAIDYKATTVSSVNMITYGGGLIFYPLGFIDNKVYFNLLGVGFSYFLGTATPKITITSDTTTTSVTSSEKGIKSHMVVDARLRYANYFNPDFFLSVALKYAFMDQLSIGTSTNQIKYSYSSVGVDLHTVIGRVFKIGVDGLQPIQKAITMPVFAGGSTATVSAPAMSGMGSLGGYLGITYKILEILLYGDYMTRGYLESSELENPIFLNTTMYNVGLKIGLLF